MSEPQNADHWASLASNLGAEPAPEKPKEPVMVEPAEAATEDQSVQAAPSPSTFRPVAKPVPAARRPARPSAWDQLAGDLGIAVPLPPPPPVRPAEVASPSATFVPAPPAEEPPRVVVEAEASLPVWDELEPPATEPESFEPQEALDIMDETADEFGDESSDEIAVTTESIDEQSTTEEGATEERRGRRRRRRRGRGRSREDAPSAETPTANESSEEPDSDESVASEFVESDVDSSAKEDAEEDRSEEGPAERRGRRRRGRGRGRDQVRDEQTGEEETAIVDDEFDFGGTEEEARSDASASDEHDFDGDEEHDGEHDENNEDADEDEDGGESPRIGFRNIPTWQDAIGMMIAKNLESRSRNPGSCAARADVAAAMVEAAVAVAGPSDGDPCFAAPVLITLPRDEITSRRA